MLNKVILIGRLTQDPELRYTPSGVAVASFTLAVDRQRANQAGEREADFINIVVWQKLGELCAQYLRKGRLAAVEGSLQIRQYENKEGQRVRVAEIIAQSVQFLDKAHDRQESSSTSQSKPAQTAPSTQTTRSTKQWENDPFADDANIPIEYDDLPF